jgi:hypothetical protein
VWGLMHIPVMMHYPVMYGSFKQDMGFRNTSDMDSLEVLM